MKASIVDLRYKMNDVLKALDRKEEVMIFYHGKLKGRLIPISDQSERSVQDHPFFGMQEKSQQSVLEELDNIRKSRVNNI